MIKIIISEMQNPIYNKASVDRDVEPDIQGLIKRRGKAKWNLDLEYKYVTSLLKARPEDPNDAVSMVDNSMIRLSFCVKIFREVYDEYGVYH